MNFINWGEETPEQKEARRRYEEEQALYEQAVRYSRMTGSMSGAAAGSSKTRPSGLRLMTSETTSYVEFSLWVLFGETINLTVDWGDGESTELTISGDEGSQDFQYYYATAGEYEIVIDSDDLAKIRVLSIGREAVSIEGLDLFTALQVFTLRDSFITDINQLGPLPNSISNFSVYANYDLTQFAPSSPLPSSLSVLYLDGPVTNLSIDIPQALTSLYVTGAPLTEDFDIRVPVGSSLDSIEINYSTGLTAFTADLSNATVLRILTLYGNSAMSTFDPVAPLPDFLDRLSLENSYSLTTFNPTYPIPNNVRYLYLNGSHISDFSLYSHPLPSNLRGLYLRNTLLTSFNTAYPLPSSFDALDLRYNAITSFAPSYSLPSSMGALYLSGCSLTSFNYALPNVYSVKLEYNVITSITLSGLGNNFGEFYASNNRLNSGQIEGILVYLNSVAVSSRYRQIYLHNQSPSANPLTSTAAAAKASLQAKGVYVLT